MRERRLKWELLKPETKSFVNKYLNDILGLGKGGSGEKKSEKEISQEIDNFLFPGDHREENTDDGSGS